MTLLDEALAMDASARSDHRESQRLRRRAARRRAELAEFCRRNGIELKLVRATKSEEDTVDGSEKRS